MLVRNLNSNECYREFDMYHIWRHLIAMSSEAKVPLPWTTDTVVI